MPTERETWLSGQCAKLRSALARRRAPGDRLALMRSLARLQGGRLDLASEGIWLSEGEAGLLRRFGLHLVEAGTLRVDDTDLEVGPPGLMQSLVLDPDQRTVFASAAADAPLLRLSQHPAYSSQTQKAAVHALLTMPAGGSLMVSMPTGSGKSLLFQLGSLWWRMSQPGACAVVVTPTVALADDHERTLQGLPGLEKSRALTGALTARARSEILTSFRRGEVPVLLLSPEVAFGSARDALLEAALAPTEKHGLQARLAGFFVDEAHIIESWGRTFRPDFQRLPALVDALRDRNPELRTILLSATLTDAARTVLRQGYGGDHWLEIHASVPRYDFDLVVQAFDDAAQRDDTLMRVIDRAPRPAIIYTTEVEKADQLHRRLIDERSYKEVALFTGDVSDAAERRRIVRDWADDEIDLVVATSAFGLGVDKSNVRSVIHACLPESPARYYQEIGRASRDKHQGLGVCLWTAWRPGLKDTDDEVASDMATNSWLSRDIAEKRWRALRDAAEVTWVGDARRLRVRLDAAREGLGRFTGQRNRRWNMSLLNLMQRAGVLSVDNVEERDDGPPVWDVVLEDDRLLADGSAWDAAWAEIFTVREAERQNAKSEVTAFKALMRGSRHDCMLTGLFELIEPEAWAPPPCGRCPTCRARGTRHPNLLAAPVAAEPWPASAHSQVLPAGVMLVSPHDPGFGAGLQKLLDRLVHVGIEQIIAPGVTLEMISSLLSASLARFGFVHDLAAWLKNPRSVADLPTALLMGEHDADAGLILDKFGALAGERRNQAFVLVANPALRIDGRPLSQIASKLAPYDEDALDAIRGDARQVFENA